MSVKLIYSYGYQTMTFYTFLEVIFCVKDFVRVSGCLRYYACIFCNASSIRRNVIHFSDQQNLDLQFDNSNDLKKLCICKNEEVQGCMDRLELVCKCNCMFYG